MDVYRHSPLIALSLAFQVACTTPAQPTAAIIARVDRGAAKAIDTLDLFDKARNRSIPIVLYHADHPQNGKKPTLVLVSHGYGENKPGSYLHFSSLAKYLTVHGCAVVSIQHELPGDELLAMKGDLRVLRRPNWERGVENILFVLNELKRTHPEIDTDHVALVGHSNGGDMSMLFAEEHPELLETVISLDNRRMPLPRVGRPRICSLRANDAPADEGVLPTAQEQTEFGIRIIQLPNTKHVDMDDRATEIQQTELNSLVLDLLDGR